MQASEADCEAWPDLDATARLSLESRIPRHDLCYARPIHLGLTLRHARQQMVVNQARQRHRRLAFLGRGKYEPRILEPKLQCEPGGLEFTIRDDPAIIRIDRRREQRVHDVQK